MAWLAALGGGAGAGALGSTAAGTAATAGAAEAAGATGASAGSVGDALMGGTTAPTTTPAANTGPFGGLADWWGNQPQWARDSLKSTATSGLGNLLSARPNLPSPIMPSSPTVSALPPMTGEPGATDASAMAPFLQALARSQGMNRFGGSPFGFGVPSGYGQ
jgi:hypothetical protein